MYSLRFPERLIDRLQEIPNASELVRKAVERELELYDDAILDSRIRLLQTRIIDSKSRILNLETELSELEALKATADKRWKAQMEARMRFLEQVRKAKQIKLDHWLDSRVDVMRDCGFKSVEEAVAWVDEQKARAVR